MSTSTLLKALAAVVAVGFIIKTSVIGFSIADLPALAAIGALGYGLYWLADRAETTETAKRDAELRRQSGPTDNW